MFMMIKRELNKTSKLQNIPANFLVTYFQIVTNNQFVRHVIRRQWDTSIKTETWESLPWRDGNVIVFSSLANIDCTLVLKFVRRQRPQATWPFPSPMEALAESRKLEFDWFARVGHRSAVSQWLPLYLCQADLVWRNIFVSPRRNSRAATAAPSLKAT